ncbi:MAG: hypothetical protein LBB89_00720 [Treponema sp.]|jgi:hypothetical protein|nr:hypothetical protein [Treponema sp.]
MPNNKAEIRTISRLLTPDNRASLLTWVRVACFAENSARKSRGFDAVMNGAFTLKPQEYSCRNN